MARRVSEKMSDGRSEPVKKEEVDMYMRDERIKKK